MADNGPHTGGMVAFLPSEQSAAALAIPNGEAQADLHVTLVYLGDDVTNWAPAQRRTVLDVVADATYGLAPVQARAFGHTTFNPDGGPDGTREPCAVYMIGDSPDLAPTRDRIMSGVAGMYLPDQHDPYVPHLTAGYGLAAADLTYTGPVTLDRIEVAFGEDRTILPLAATYRPGLADMPMRAEYASSTLGRHGLLELAGPPAAVRNRMAKAGTALPDGSFPIASKADVRKAVLAYGRASESKRTAVRRHIIKRARALDAIDLVPEDWLKTAS